MVDAAETARDTEAEDADDATLDLIDHRYDRVIRSRVGGYLVEDLAAEIACRDMGTDAVSVRMVVSPSTGQCRVLSTDERGELAAVTAAQSRVTVVRTHRVERPTRDEFRRVRQRLTAGADGVPKRRTSRRPRSR